MLLLMLAAALPARAGVRQLASNALPSGALALNNAGQAAWWDHGLNLWDGSAVRRLTQGEGGSLQDPSQLSDSGQIVWEEVSGSDYTVNLWDGTRARVLAQYGRSVEPPRVNAAGQAVWEGDGQIYLWDGAQVRLLSGGATLNETPRINGAGQVVWEGDGQIYLWDGSTVQRLTRPLPGHAFTNLEPQINASGQAVWVGGLDKQGSNVYFWDGLDAWRLTQHGGGVRAPLLNDAGQIIWARTDSSGQPQELDLWDGTRIRTIQPAGSGLPFYFHDQINDRGQVIWDGQRPEDNSIRVFLWENGTARDLAGRPVSDPLPELGEGGEAVWRDRQDGSSELFVWDGRSVRQISNSRGRGAATSVNLWFSPVNRAGQVVWSDGSGVYLYTPPVPGSLELEPGSLLEGRTALGTITLPQPAPPGGAVVTLASDNPAVTVPATVALPAGTTSATFPVQTTVLPRAGSATISATAGGDTWKATLAITHTALASIGLEVGALTVMLDGPAPPGGALVTVTSDHPEALQLAGDGPGGPSGTVTTTIAAGYDRATLAYWTRPVPLPTPVHISADYGGVNRVATLSLSPPPLTGLSFGTAAPSVLPGGTFGFHRPSCSGSAVSVGAAVEGTLALAGPVAAEGLTVALASDDPAASVPPTVEVPGGANGASFPIILHPVNASTVVHIAAAAGGITRTVELTVLPYSLAAVTVDPAAVIGGQSATGSVQLSAPAPPGGVMVALFTDWPLSQDLVPPMVTVPAGETMVQFPIATQPERLPIPITLFACYGGVLRSAMLELLPPEKEPAGVGMSEARVVMRK